MIVIDDYKAALRQAMLPLTGIFMLPKLSLDIFVGSRRGLLRTHPFHEGATMPTCAARTAGYRILPEQKAANLPCEKSNPIDFI
jgi:hypothetical protein